MFSKALIGTSSGIALGMLFHQGKWIDPLWWISFFLFLPLWLSPALSIRKEFSVGLLFGLGFNGVGLFWLVPTMVHFGHVPAPLAIFGFLLLCLYMSLFPAAFWAGFSFLRREFPTILLPVIAASLWSVSEVAKGVLFTGFPWNPLGSLAFGHPPFLQMASITGTTGLSFLIVLANGWLAIGIEGIRKTDRASTLKRLAPLILFFLQITVWSTIGKQTVQPQSKVRSLLVSIIQGNIPQDQKWTGSFVRESIQTYLSMSRKAIQQGGQLLVWPETALPVAYNAPPFSVKKMVDQVFSLPVPILTGTLGVERDKGDHSYQFSNDAIGINDLHSSTQVYQKTHLVPFGEYIPLPALFGWLRNMTGITGDLTTGKKPEIFLFPIGGRTVSAAPVICYEALYPSLIRRLSIRNPDLLIVLSDDAWFGNSDAPYQLFRQSLMRSVENGIPLIRSANSGISGAIDPNGSVSGVTSLFKQQVVTIPLRLDSHETFYRKHGEWVFRLSLIILLCLCAFLKMSGPRQERIFP
ncbi:MAG: apolipoprotein N-acyltransferase [Leptospirales bacterium]